MVRPFGMKASVRFRGSGRGTFLWPACGLEAVYDGEPLGTYVPTASCLRGHP